MRLSFKNKLLGAFAVIFLLYSIALVVMEYQHNKEYKTEVLKSRLDGYLSLIHNYIEQNHIKMDSLEQIRPIVNSMSENVRVTIIDSEGKVLFDKDVKDYTKLDNHLDRIEIKSAFYQDYGTNIRKSETTQQEYMYYAKFVSDYYVRVALPYDTYTKRLLAGDNHIIYTSLVLFLIVLVFLYFVVNRFNHSILDLKRLTRKVKNHEDLPKDIEFSDDELGDISKELVHILEQKDASQKSLEAEREKLRKHFQYSAEGLAFYNSDFKKVYANTHFIQFANLLASRPTINVESIFEDDSFAKITDFIKDKHRKENNLSILVNKDGKTFSIKTIVFDDCSFELTIKDITQIEKTRVLKQEMTSNIAHELRTPVTVLRGYLETLNEQELPAEKTTYFIDKAYQQSIRLSGLIEDISLLSKIEEQNSTFAFEKVFVSQLIENIRINFSEKMKENDTTLISSVAETIAVRGNYNLLMSAFQNLVQNSLNYAGKGIEIHLDCYTDDDLFYYFSYYDTGVGVDEKYLGRLFERFYRIDSGRDRNSGGSGLGLSIVKNIILLHRGDIQIKRHASGGLEFLFKLPKI